MTSIFLSQSLPLTLFHMINTQQLIHFFLTNFLREAFGLARRLPPPH